MEELNRVLGGGVVPGSLILIGGDPGIGKSTLMLQVSGQLSKAGKILYVSGEESASQIKMRATRLGVNGDQLYVYPETDMDVIKSTISELKPDAVVIDSVQTMQIPELQSATGSVAQIREVTADLMNIAKGQGITVFVVGHVTKGGAIAGPKILEHMVDTVLYFEGDLHHSYRILRTVKKIVLGRLMNWACLKCGWMGSMRLLTRPRFSWKNGLRMQLAQPLSFPWKVPGQS